MDSSKDASDDDSNLENNNNFFEIPKSPGVSVKSYPRAKASLKSNNASPKLFPIFQKNFRPVENQLKAVQLEVEKTNPQKRRRTMLRKDPEGLTQMVLDAGQKQIGAELCTECNLLYSPGDFDDEEEHRKAHIRIQNTFKLSLWKDTRILFTYPDGCQIIMVQTDTDEARIKNRLKDFQAWLDSELGVGYDPSGIKKSERIFLYVARTSRKNVVRILGCGIMELPDPSKICLGSLVSKTSTVSDQNTIPSPALQSESKCDDEDNSVDSKLKVLVGVTRLWTDSGFRRRNIASRLCEMMRFNSGILAYVVPKENIGILEPSEAGQAFMAKYTNSLGAKYTYLLPV